MLHFLLHTGALVLGLSIMLYIVIDLSTEV